MRNLLDKKVDEREAMEKGRKTEREEKTTGANIVWIMILALFAAPIGAPILISILIVLLCAALCAALLDMSVFLIAVVGVVAGIKMLLRGILAVSVSFGGFCFITGMGVFMLGILSILCAVFGVYFAKWMGRLFVWCTRKVTKKEEADHENGQNSITDRMCLLYCRCSADVQRMGKRRKKHTRKRMI